jgi:hypothetical protein
MKRKVIAAARFAGFLAAIPAVPRPIPRPVQQPSGGWSGVRTRDSATDPLGSGEQQSFAPRTRPRHWLVRRSHLPR